MRIHDLTLIDEGKKFRVSVCKLDARWPGTSTTISTYFFSGEVGIETEGCLASLLGQAPALLLLVRLVFSLCIPPSPRVSRGVSRGIAEQKQKPSRRRRVRRPPPSRSTALATSFSLALPLSRGWHRPPLCTLRLGGPCSRRQSSPEDSANRSRRPDASPTNPSDSLTLATLPLLSNMRYKFAIRLVRGIRMGE